MVEDKTFDDINDGEEFDDDDDDEKGRIQRTVKRQDMSKGKYGHDGLTQTYTDPADGTVYIWDREKNAWFPKVHYNNSYFYYIVYSICVLIRMRSNWLNSVTQYKF